MSDVSIKQQLLEMSLSGILEVVEIIRSRPDVSDLLLVTKKEYDEMDDKFKCLILNSRKTENEPA
jgi:hypothetical protein